MSKTAIVTGATSGIGLEFARQIAGAGYDLVVGGRRAPLLDQHASEIRELGVEVVVVVGDLADERVIAELTGHARDCEILINNAGYGHGGHVADLPLDDLLHMMRVHQEASLRLIRAALPGMRTRGSGLIINVGSMAGRPPVPGGAIYSATKAFLERFSESLALENARHGIVVQALLPGFVRTDFHRDQTGTAPYRRRRFGWLQPDTAVRISMRHARRARRRLARRPNSVPAARHTVVITGVLYRFLALVARMMPRRMTYSAALAFERRNRYGASDAGE